MEEGTRAGTKPDEETRELSPRGGHVRKRSLRKTQPGGPAVPSCIARLSPGRQHREHTAL